MCAHTCNYILNRLDCIAIMRRQVAWLPWARRQVACALRRHVEAACVFLIFCALWLLAVAPAAVVGTSGRMPEVGHMLSSRAQSVF